MMDTIVALQQNNKDFWRDNFYYKKDQFDEGKTRLFFQHGNVNLLWRCASQFDKVYSYSEGLLLFACIVHNTYSTSGFTEAIRRVRNLVVNSDNELRETDIGKSYIEVENFIQRNDYLGLQHFKTDQINEEKSKHEFLSGQPGLMQITNRLEDSDIQRGSISLFDWHHPAFPQRVSKFMEFFDQPANNFGELSNLLLCFDDYSQDDKKWTNLLTDYYNPTVIRRFFTTPGFNKDHFNKKTRPVVEACLDYFISSPNITVRQKLDAKLLEYKNAPKDWKFYFISYSSFREGVLQGYYFWKDDNSCYTFNKMKERQANGFNWDPFLYEIQQSIGSNKLTLGGFDSKLKLTLKRGVVDISTLGGGFKFENANDNKEANVLMKDMQSQGLISADSEFKIKQNSDGIDEVDRIVSLKKVIYDLLAD